MAGRAHVNRLLLIRLYMPVTKHYMRVRDRGSGLLVTMTTKQYMLVRSR